MKRKLRRKSRQSCKPANSEKPPSNGLSLKKSSNTAGSWCRPARQYAYAMVNWYRSVSSGGTRSRIDRSIASHVFRHGAAMLLKRWTQVQLKPRSLGLAVFRKPADSEKEKEPPNGLQAEKRGCTQGAVSHLHNNLKRPSGAFNCSRNPKRSDLNLFLSMWFWTHRRRGQRWKTPSLSKHNLLSFKDIVFRKYINSTMGLFFFYMKYFPFRIVNKQSNVTSCCDIRIQLSGLFSFTQGIIGQSPLPLPDSTSTFYFATLMVVLMTNGVH